MIGQQQKQSDIPLPAAIMLLVLVIAALVVGPNAARWEQLGLEIDGFIGRYPGIVSISVGALFLNAFATHLFAQKWFSYRRQGQRLRELTGESGRDYRRLRIATLIVSGATACYAIVLNVATTRYGADLQRTPETLLYLMTLNMALAGAIMSHWIWRVWARIRAHRHAAAPLAEPTPSANCLILGTTFREVAHGEGA